jgi:hypothetical protein
MVTVIGDNCGFKKKIDDKERRVIIICRKEYKNWLWVARARAKFTDLSGSFTLTKIQ